jgi:hypothetical protein
LKKLILGALLGSVGVLAYQQYTERPASAEGLEAQSFYSDSSGLGDLSEEPPEPQYNCDGRIYCSQMTSCEEAEYFLANCPGVKMDGGGDGVPCERQWCGNR